jgi:hypothetical protein
MPSNQSLKPVDRRSFLKSSAAITATTALAGAPAIVSAQSLTNPVNYGFIGSGRQGSNHLKHLATVTTGRCAVICDIYPPNLKKGVETIGGNPDTIPDDYRRVLDRKDIEAVFIVTPYHLHVPMVLDALERRQACVCREGDGKDRRGHPKGHCSGQCASQPGDASGFTAPV